jgi:hypothetical protein
MNTAGTGAMHCAHCGRPAMTLVWVGGMGYHAECTRGPGWVQDTYQSPPQPWGFPPPQWPALTEQRVRQIVREELDARLKTPNAAMNGGHRPSVR